MTEMIKVSVAYALPDDSFWQYMTVEAGITAREAIEQSGVLQRFPALELEKLKIGVYMKLVKLDHVLADGDRVEIYRPLMGNPKEIAKKAKALKEAREKGEA